MSSSRLIFRHYEETGSTQDVAKQALSGLTPDQILAVTADEQTKGRGTSGRSWMGLRGNVFLTMAFPSQFVPTILTLLPLQVGVLVAQRVDKLLKDACHSSVHKVQVKWPNDVLVNDEKVAGILIESQLVDDTVWLLVGVGVNLAAAPLVPTQGPDRGRAATAIQSFCGETVLPDQTAQVFATDLTQGMAAWLESSTSSSQSVVTEWKAWASLGKPQKVRETGETVIPVDVKEDGQLYVQGQDGTMRYLVADYLF
jgi:BirA family biotin operon repressor/biotin-[acetyl-CoA-carboxylase] ligase